MNGKMWIKLLLEYLCLTRWFYVGTGYDFQKPQYYNIWALDTQNITVSTSFNYEQESPLQELFVAAQHNHDLSSCYYLFGSNKEKLFQKGRSQSVKCDMLTGGTKRVDQHSEPASHNMLLPLERSCTYIEIKRTFDKKYVVKSLLLDLNIKYVSAVSLSMYTFQGEENLLTYGRSGEDCRRHFQDNLGIEKCRDLKSTSGFLFYQVEGELVASGMVIRVYISDGAVKEAVSKPHLEIRNILVWATCHCGDHSTGCMLNVAYSSKSINTRTRNIKEMVKKVLSCVCSPGYCNSRCTGRWQKQFTVPTQTICKESGIQTTRNRRRACSCNPAGTLYGLCHPLFSLGNKCLCRRNYVGRFCDRCANGFFGYPKCSACLCSPFGSVSSLCKKDNGKCICKNLPLSSRKFQGRTCSQCPKGYFGFPFCRGCRCSFGENTFGMCDSRTGKCSCMVGYAGKECDKCAFGYYGFPNCTACNCTTAGSLSSGCDDDGKCLCKENFSGETCDECKPGYKNYPYCYACGCSKSGSHETACDFVTGQCSCKDGFTGLKCGKCEHLLAVYPECRKDCYCDFRGVHNDALKGICGHESKQCPCKEFVTGERCSRCKLLFFNLTAENPSGCHHCRCVKSGTVGGLGTCNQLTGQCLCKDRVVGRTCSRCKDGFFGLSSTNPFGCHACNCNIGGSVGIGCDEHGACTCKEGVIGLKCDRLNSELIYVPSLYQLNFEVEEGRTLQGEAVRYRYNYAEFPNFSWRGYITLGVAQSIVVLNITVPMPAVYHVALKYILQRDNDVTCVVRIRDRNNPDTFQYGLALMKSSLNKLSKSQYAYVTNTNDGFDLAAGSWELIISSTATGLLLDHIVLMPDEYFKAWSFKKKPMEPCVIGQRPFEMCETYKFLPLEGNGNIKYEAENAYTWESQNNKNKKKPEMFIDPDILSQLNSNGMVAFSKSQKVLYFDIKTLADGPHYLVLSFFNPDSITYRIGVYADHGQGFAETSSCTLRFICRVVVLSGGGSPMPIMFKKSRTKTIILVANVAGILAVDSVTAVPASSWAEDYIRPSLYCIILNGICTKPSEYPSSKVEIDLEPDDGNPADPLTGAVRAGGEVPITYRAPVSSIGSYSLVYQYYQPHKPAFDVKATLHHGDADVFYLRIKFCPSTSACRQYHKVNISSYNATLTLQVPAKQEFWIDRIFLVPAYEFFPDILSTEIGKRSQLFKTKCFNDHGLPFETPRQEFCRKAMFSLSLRFNRVPQLCNCSPLGSLSRKCDTYGGQCKCRPNVIGRRCEKCRTGYFRYPNCQPCRCFPSGSTSPDCSIFGQCSCKPQFGGWRCTRCNSVGYYGFPECKPCLCDTEGSLSTFCRGSNGQCQCRINFEGRTCNKCRVGYHSYPECKRCNCNPAGIIVTPEHPTGCPNGTLSQCRCKQNVEGTDCDRCKSLFYNLDVNNEFGCSPCNCNAAGTLSGIKSCHPSSGKCFCKPFVAGRTCDRCLDGYYQISEDNVFGCRACNCNPGGSVDTTCNKRTGQCKCRPNIHGRKCDRVTGDGFYIPTLYHIISKPASSVNIDTLGVAESGERTKFVGRQTSILLALDVPRSTTYFVALKYKLRRKTKEKLAVIIVDSVTSSKVFMNTVDLEPQGNRTDYQITVLKDFIGMLEVWLNQRKYWVEVLYNKTLVEMHSVALVPRSYFLADVLKESVTEPCTVSGLTADCVEFAYLPLPREGVFTIEAESVRQSIFNITEPGDVQGLNFNGAVNMEPSGTLTFPMTGNFNGSYILVFQYNSRVAGSVPFELSVTTGDTVVMSHGNFSHCPYVFGCRQAILDNQGILKKFYIPLRVNTWSVSVKIIREKVSIDLLTVVPENVWSIDFISPAQLCVKRKGSCIETSYFLPERRYFIEAEAADMDKSKPVLPPGILDSETGVVYLDQAKTSLGWNVKLPRGRYVVLLRYYQPNEVSFHAKVIVSTQRRAVAGKMLFEYCPRVTGCHGVLKDFVFDNQPFTIYISLSPLVVSVTLPKGVSLWLDYILLIPLYEFSENILKEEPFDYSARFRSECIDDHLILREPASKFCENALFQVTTEFNNGPLECRCNQQGSLSSKCSHVGGRCTCKPGVGGDSCETCKPGLRGFPFCRQKADS